MPAGEQPRTAAQELARLVAEATERRQLGAPVPVDGAVVRDLIVRIVADDAAADAFFAALSVELHARGARLPALEELPPNLLPLVAMVGVALDVGQDGEIDWEAAAMRLDEMLRQQLGVSPRQAQAEDLHRQIRTEIARDVAESLRRHGLVPAGDPTSGDEFWDCVELARNDRPRFLQELAVLPAKRLAEFFAAHTAAALELRRAGLAAERGADPTSDPLAAWIIAQGFDYHAAVVAYPSQAPASTPEPGVDLGADAARVYRERFGKDIRLDG